MDENFPLTWHLQKEAAGAGPLYDLGIRRDGCWFCPNCAKREREHLKETRPDLVEKIYAMIDMCDYDISIFLRSGRHVWVDEYKKDRGMT